MVMLINLVMNGLKARLAQQDRLLNGMFNYHLKVKLSLVGQREMVLI